MTDRDLERLLDTWFGDGPTVAPDRVLEIAANRIDRQRQRPAWRLLDWRPRTMSTPMRLVAVIGALLVAAVAASLLLTGGGARPSTPAPSTSPTASPVAIVHDGRSLAPGAYVAALQAGRLTFTLPAGWSSPEGSDLDITLHRAAGPAEDTVKVFTDMRRAAKDAACTEAPDLGVPPTTAALLSDLAADANLRTTDAGTVQLAGGDGAAIDLTLAPGVTRTCPFSSGQPSVPLVVDSLPGSGSFWGIGPNERIRLVAIQAPRGHNLVVAMDSAAGTSFDDLTAATMPIVRSFAFEAAQADAPLATPPACEDNLAGCVGVLDAGVHASNAFQPGLTFTAPAGWKNVVDTPTIFKLDSVAGTDPYLLVWSNPAIPDGCGPAVKKGTGTKVGDFVAFLSAHPGIQVLASGPVTVGRWSGRALDLRVKDTWTNSCPGLSSSAVQFIVDTDPLAGTPVYGAAGGSRMHVLFLDVNGRTVIVQAYTPDSDAGQTAALAAVQPLIDSFQFAAGS